MALVKDWIGGFLKRHQARYDPHDWPLGAADTGDEDSREEVRQFVLGWITALRLAEITEAEADEASRRLTSSPPNYRREHIPAIVNGVKEIRRERGANSGNETREMAQAMSRTCSHCCGGGLASVYHRFGGDEPSRIPASRAALCLCPHGRWIKRRHAESSPDLLRGFIDLADAQSPYSEWQIDPPGMLASEPETEPAEMVSRGPDRQEINAAF